MQRPSLIWSRVLIYFPCLKSVQIQRGTLQERTVVRRPFGVKARDKAGGWRGVLKRPCSPPHSHGEACLKCRSQHANKRSSPHIHGLVATLSLNDFLICSIYVIFKALSEPPRPVMSSCHVAPSIFTRVGSRRQCPRYCYEMAAEWVMQARGCDSEGSMKREALDSDVAFTTKKGCFFPK